MPNYGPCEYCGPVCYRGAVHNARVEDGYKWSEGKPSASPAPTPDKQEAETVCDKPVYMQRPKDSEFCPACGGHIVSHWPYKQCDPDEVPRTTSPEPEGQTVRFTDTEREPDELGRLRKLAARLNPDQRITMTVECFRALEAEIASLRSQLDEEKKRAELHNDSAIEAWQKCHEWMTKHDKLASELADAEHKGWNDAIEAVMEGVDTEDLKYHFIRALKKEPSNG